MMLDEKKHEPKVAEPSVARVTTSELLFSGARELVIKHVGEDYRLRLTNQGKLILTK
jgi:hemin uptake protein HemP